jgi:hypothetical protein
MGGGGKPPHPTYLDGVDWLSSAPGWQLIGRSSSANQLLIRRSNQNLVNDAVGAMEVQ